MKLYILIGLNIYTWAPLKSVTNFSLISKQMLIQFKNFLKKSLSFLLLTLLFISKISLQKLMLIYANPQLLNTLLYVTWGRNATLSKGHYVEFFFYVKHGYDCLENFPCTRDLRRHILTYRGSTYVKFSVSK